MLITEAPGRSNRGREPAQVDGDEQVDLDDVGDVGQRLVLQQTSVADPRGVHQHVQAAVPIADGIDQRGPERRVPQISRNHERRV